MFQAPSNGDKKIDNKKNKQEPPHPLWYHNFKANPEVEIQDGASILSMTVDEINEPKERQRLWDLSVEAYPPYQEYQQKTDRVIPVFLASPNR